MIRSMTALIAYLRLCRNLPWRLLWHLAGCDGYVFAFVVLTRREAEISSRAVTGFPFNVQTDPMYNGSTMCFLGTALW